MRRKSVLKDLVYQSSEILLDLSFKWVREGKIDFAKNAIRILEEIRRETNIRIPIYMRRMYCKKCYVPLIPGLTARVRIIGRGKMLRRVVTCLSCGEIYRLEFMKNKIKTDCS